jgi:predicted DNA-binding ribbon-helix-helix protein
MVPMSIFYILNIYNITSAIRVLVTKLFKEPKNNFGFCPIIVI